MWRSRSFLPRLTYPATCVELMLGSSMLALRNIVWSPPRKPPSIEACPSSALLKVNCGMSRFARICSSFSSVGRIVACPVARPPKIISLRPIIERAYPTSNWRIFTVSPSLCWAYSPEMANLCWAWDSERLFIFKRPSWRLMLPGSIFHIVSLTAKLVGKIFIRKLLSFSLFILRASIWVSLEKMP